ncbi:DUF3152 domain-containing protein [Streptomonospora litoralis]|uniref:DUF3152 domain-containing protein n=1 Tax=Streptomonospora litoralis TaxID=2498135 RepID=A0A4P6Q2G9_9ACTN|nr:DUF3152 domain-containing protein [Streptomonospora litoralis]QBI52974.1 hypothetical protein EKD16_05855 [Streptomonospora litoralis]
MSHPSSNPLRDRRGPRRRRLFGLELLLGLAVIAAGSGLLVLDQQAPQLTEEAGSSSSAPLGEGAGDASASATATAPQAAEDGQRAEGGDGGRGGEDTETPSGSAEGSASGEPSQSPASPGARGGEGDELPAVMRSVEDEVKEASGDLQVVPGETEPAGEGSRRRYLVEVEEGLPGEAADFAAAVEQILADKRGWRGAENLSMQRVDEGPVDFRVALAAPETVDRLCAPLQTMGRVSCTNGGRAVINQNRWVSGVPHFDGDLRTYRIYVVNHEVGHALGHGHVDCPAKGEPAPVMQQQTFGLQGCEANGWVQD